MKKIAFFITAFTAGPPLQQPTLPAVPFSVRSNTPWSSRWSMTNTICCCCCCCCCCSCCCSYCFVDPIMCSNCLLRSFLLELFVRCKSELPLGRNISAFTCSRVSAHVGRLEGRPRRPAPSCKWGHLSLSQLQQGLRGHWRVVNASCVRRAALQ